MSTQQVSGQRTRARRPSRSAGRERVAAHPVVAQLVTALLAPARSRLWTPRHVVVTRSAAERPHTAEILRRVEAAGVDDVEFLRGDRHHGPARAPTSARPTRGPRRRWPSSSARRPSASCSRSRRAPTGGSTSPRAARRTASTATSPARSPGRRSPGSTPTSTRSWPGSTRTSAPGTSPPAPTRAGTRARRSRPPATPTRSASSTSPAAWPRRSRTSARTRSPGPVQLRATTKFGGVEPLLDLPHGGRTRIRASVNSASAARFEGGTDPVADPARRARRASPAPATRSA